MWYCGRPLSLWDSYRLHQYELGTGCFSEDRRGRWYLNVTVEVAKRERSSAIAVVGLDLGLKDFAATSDVGKSPATASIGTWSRRWRSLSGRISCDASRRCTPKSPTGAKTRYTNSAPSS